MGSILDAVMGVDRAAGRDNLRMQEASHANLTQGLGEWDQYLSYLDTLKSPYDEGTINAMTTQQRDISGSAAQEQMNAARRMAGASGLGGGGALAGREQMIRDEMSRRNAASSRDIRSQAALANNQFQQSIAGARGGALSARTGLLAASPVNLSQPFGASKFI